MLILCTFILFLTVLLPKVLLQHRSPNSLSKLEAYLANRKDIETIQQKGWFYLIKKQIWMYIIAILISALILTYVLIDPYAK